VRPSAEPTAEGLVVHEWGTFTSFSGSDGVRLEFRPLADEDLPPFVLDRFLQAGAGARAAKIAPNAAKGPSSWPLPGLCLGVCGGSALIGAAPSGSMNVSCARAGVADAKAQIVAVDSNMTEKRFMFLAPVEPDEPLPLLDAGVPRLLRCKHQWCSAVTNLRAA
jgi:hypothetical protein